MATSAAGTALAGTLVGAGPRLVLLLGSLVVASSVAVATTDRHVTQKTSGPPS
jgi:hypothetical protein